METKVTSAIVHPFKENLGYVKATAEIIINDCFVVRGLRVMEGENGLFVGYPNDPFYKGEEFRTLFNPITRKLREDIDKAVLDRYNAMI